MNEILLSLTSDGKTWFDMTDGEEDILRVLANQEENTLAKVQAQNVLHLVFGDSFPISYSFEALALRFGRACLLQASMGGSPDFRRNTC